MTGPAQVGDEFTLENYRNFFTDGFYLKILLNTFWLGAVVVVVLSHYRLSGFLFPGAHTIALARPAAVPGGAPLLISAVVRNIGWFPILSNAGLVNWLLLKSGLISQPFRSSATSPASSSASCMRCCRS